MNAYIVYGYQLYVYIFALCVGVYISSTRISFYADVKKNSLRTFQDT